MLLDADQSIVGQGSVMLAMLTCGCVVAKKSKNIPLTGCDDGGEECDTLRQSQSGNPQVNRSGDVPFQVSESLSLKYCHTTAHTTSYVSEPRCHHVL